MANPKSKAQRSQAVIRLLILVGILLLVNVLASRFHTGLDLTADRRFTLSAPTRNILRNLPETVVIDVYLDGKDLPPLAQQLREATRERLESFRSVAGNKIVVRFSDPFAGVDPAGIAEVQRNLLAKGIRGTIGSRAGAGNYTEKIIVPYALMRMGGKELSVRLIETSFASDDGQSTDKSISLLEYRLASVLRMLQEPARPEIAWITGHGEALGPETWYALRSLSSFYDVDTFDLSQPGNFRIPEVFAAAIICKPRSAFSDEDKFAIDQYVMHGGKLLWMIDPMQASLDSLRNEEKLFMSVPNDIGLDDILFTYGVRLNSDLLEDKNNNPIPVTTGQKPDGTAQIELKPFSFFPVFIPGNEHPIVRNLQPVMSRFASSIDSLGTPDVKKTYLLTTSQYGSIQPSPVRVAMSMLQFPLPDNYYTKPHKPAAVLLEGNFKSVFATRTITPEFAAVLRDSLHYEYKQKVDSSNSMIVIADGDIALNEFTPKEPYPMGYYRYAGAMYANQTFFLNCLEYLIAGKNNLLEAEAKDIPVRQLDVPRAEAERTQWQVLNIALPIGLLAVFASAWIFFRKRRYGTKSA